jgi:toxin HigB-1
MKVPSYIAEKLKIWIDLVETEGMMQSRKIKSYHDEPLKGKRKGQRSIRLSKAYRAIYVERKNGTLLQSNINPGNMVLCILLTNGNSIYEY